MKKILIVDDSAFMRKLLKDILMTDTVFLKKHTLTFYEASGKKEAFQHVKKIAFDAILLDIVMVESETEGIEFVEEIRDIFDVNKIIMISSVSQPVLYDKCDQLGITRYLNKPLVAKNIIESVSQVLA